MADYDPLFTSLFSAFIFLLLTLFFLFFLFLLFPLLPCIFYFFNYPLSIIFLLHFDLQIRWRILCVRRGGGDA
jgi:hypothetical protein